jgi:mannose-6-phosphate isomerase
MRPLRLAPNRLRRFYRGGAGIAELRGIPDDEAYAPEDWVGSTTAAFGSSVDGMTTLPGGKLLRDEIAADPEGYLGPRHVRASGADPGLLVKLLHAGERLPVHCHPDDAFAGAQLHRGCGKTEAWVIVGVPATGTAPAAASASAASAAAGEVFVGFREEVAEAVLAGWVERQEVGCLLGALNPVPVEPGDALLVPAGVPHAIGVGILLVELQQPTDLSVLLEWRGFAIDGEVDGHLGIGFPRALGCVDRSAWNAARLAHTWTAGPPRGHDPAVERLLPSAADPFFAAERIRPAAGAVWLEPAFSILVVVGGAGRLEAGTDPDALQLARGDTVLVPYGAGATSLSGPLDVVRCLPPRRPAEPAAAAQAPAGS